MAHSFPLINEELVRWKRRQEEVEQLLRQLNEEEERLVRELAKAERQVSYYNSLTGDMKRELEPPGLASMLNAFRKA